MKRKQQPGRAASRGPQKRDLEGSKTMEELHLSRKDFEIVWFSGQGPGGQHRNRHSNCCRITHKETGLTAQCTAHKERSANRREAFEVLAARILDHYQNAEPKERRRGGEVI